MATEHRLIDANALDALEDLDYDYAPVRDGCAWYRAADVWACIENQPTVDAVPVVHGRWELHGNDDDCGCSYFCSNCHKSYDEDYFYVHGQYIPYNYCPNCGAKMDGDGNGI